MIPGSGRSAGEGIGYPLQYSWASLVAQMVKESACIAGDLDWEDPLKKGMATQLQHSGLEKSMDRGAWQATDHGVTKSQTELKWLSTQDSLTGLQIKIQNWV